MKAPKRLGVLAVLYIVGLVSSLILSDHYYRIRSGAGSFRSFCNMGQTMNCDVVAASPYAEFIAGIPLSSFATGWYLALLIIAIVAFNPYWRRESLRAILALSALASVMSVFYFFIMASVLKTFCLFCLVLDGVNLGSLVLVASLRPERFSQHKLDSAKWKVFLGTLFATLLVSILSLKALDQQSADRGAIDEASQSVLAAGPVAIDLPESLPSIGPKDAPITIVEFSDFQCPYCRMGAMTLNAVVNRYPGKVRVVFRNFPLDPSCNRMMQNAGHPVACEAARLAVCAHEQGKFQPVYEGLFEKQSQIAPGKLTELVAEAHLDPTALQACLAGESVKSAITRDVEEGLKLGFRGTPTFYVNGRKVEGPYPLPVWIKIIDRLLAP